LYHHEALIKQFEMMQSIVDKSQASETKQMNACLLEMKDSMSQSQAEFENLMKLIKKDKYNKFSSETGTMNNTRV
jgi:hypothetical protein